MIQRTCCHAVRPWGDHKLKVCRPQLRRRHCYRQRPEREALRRSECVLNRRKVDVCERDIRSSALDGF